MIVLSFSICILSHSPTMFITNFTVSGGEANDFSSVNWPLSIFSNACRAASSTGSALALVRSVVLTTGIVHKAFCLQFDCTSSLHFLHFRFLRFDLSPFVIGEGLNTLS